MSKMKRLLLITLLGLLLLGCENKRGAFLEQTPLAGDFPTERDKLIRIIKEQGLTHFETIDHAQMAKEVGIRLKPETVVIFGNPHMGSKLMECNPSMGLDLPIRILLSTTYEGETSMTYTNPEYWSLKHNIKDKQCLAIIKNMTLALHSIQEEMTKPKEKK